MDGHGWNRALVAGLLLLTPAGCGEESAPESLEGAGIRVLLPSEAEDWDAVTVELRQQNRVSPPTCGKGVALAAGAGPVPGEDTCTRKSVEIWNLLGERVVYEPDIPFLRVPWDTRDDAGAFVPPGVYTTHEVCLDSQGDFTFDGFYYVVEPEQVDDCLWMVWSDAFDPKRLGKRIEIKSFPVRFGAFFSYRDEQDHPFSVLVSFDNPYTLIVEAPDGRRFSREVELVTGEFTEVRVVFGPSAVSSEE